MAILYLTGHHVIPYERFYGLVVDAEEETLVMVNPSVDTGCMCGDVPERTYLDDDGPFAQLKEAVGNCHKLAVETRYFTMATGQMFDLLGCPYADIGHCVAQLRMYKDEAEVAYIAFAAQIVDEALAYVSDKIVVGMTEKELNMMLFSFMSKYPGFISNEFIILVLAGPNSANPHGSSGDYAFKRGDIILLDFCAYYNYYWSDITRCLFVGEVGNPVLEDIYNIVLKANLAAINAVKPGVAAKDVDHAARSVIEQAGYGKHFIHRTGHGLGLSVHEEPYITGNNGLILEEGMTFTIEPGIYLEGIGGVRIEDDILVTNDGCRILTKTTKDLARHILTL